MVVCAFNPIRGRWISEFEDILVYIVQGSQGYTEEVRLETKTRETAGEASPAMFVGCV